MIRKLLLPAFLVSLLLTAFIASGADAPPNDLNKQYDLAFLTRRVDDSAPLKVAVVNAGDGRIQLTACVMDGGCITRETLNIMGIEKPADGGVTVINLTYALYGQPCKALFIRELLATMRLPGPGAYRIKLWLHETYHQTGPVLLGEREIKLPK